MNFKQLHEQTNEKIKWISDYLKTTAPGSAEYNEYFYKLKNLEVRAESFAKDTMPLLRCVRCQNQWQPRNFPPRYCSKCKSSLWDAPRKYANENSFSPFKRTKATGRAAAYLKKKNCPELKKQKLYDERGALYGKIDRQTERIENLRKEFDNAERRRADESELASRYFEIQKENENLAELNARLKTINFNLKDSNNNSTKPERFATVLYIGGVLFIANLDLRREKQIIKTGLGNTKQCEQFAAANGLKLVEI